jgi:hypothetical protein
MTDNELAFLTIKIQELLNTRTRQDILTAVSEGFLAASNDRQVPGLGMVDPRVEDAPELLEISEGIRKLGRI